MHGGDIGILIILGVSIFGGMLGAWGFRRLRIPQVVGYICMGLIIGQSGFKLVTLEDIQALKPLNLFALGIIGFLVGGEIQLSTLRKYARQFTAILLGEGLMAFLLVSGASFLLLWAVVHNVSIALAGAVVLGAIASATDPASTMDVLWENRSRGVLTTAIVAIVALDDALAMILYGLGTAAAEVLTGAHESVLRRVGEIGIELFGAIGLGVLLAWVLSFFLRWLHKPERSLSLALGVILLAIGTAALAKMDVILATMTLGFVLTNIAPRRSKQLFEVVRSFSVPIYVLFFVFVGARLSLHNMPLWLWGIVLAYVVFRSVGKMWGARLGARMTHSDPMIQKYLGSALFAQGGVAVGLSIMASQHMQGIMITEHMALGDMVIFTVTATTLIVQLGGPPFVKWAITASGEAGRNVTEEDIIDALTVGDVMHQPVVTVPEHESLRRIVATFSKHDQMVYPVVDKEFRLVGAISSDELRSVLADQSAWEWLLATDVMVGAEDRATREDPLNETLIRMRDLQLDQLPVVESEGNPRPVGMLTLHQVRKHLAEAMLAREQQDAT